MKSGWRKERPGTPLTADEKAESAGKCWGFCRRCARRGAAVVGRERDREYLDELTAVALAGLAYGLDCYRKEFGVNPITYAGLWARNYVAHHLRVDRCVRGKRRTPLADLPAKKDDPLKGHLNGWEPNCWTDWLASRAYRPHGGPVRWMESDWSSLLGCLSPKDAEAVRLVYREGLTFREAATRMGVSAERINQRMTRAYRVLRESRAVRELADAA